MYTVTVCNVSVHECDCKSMHMACWPRKQRARPPTLRYVCGTRLWMVGREQVQKALLLPPDQIYTWSPGGRVVTLGSSRGLWSRRKFPLGLHLHLSQGTVLLWTPTFQIQNEDSKHPSNLTPQLPQTLTPQLLQHAKIPSIPRISASLF